ncbi:mitochondrial carrier domain-containing protein [Chaetomium strumarium]|uniref:Mitochondrial carrier domain-containing protein n=1 Tax=Chaetomium strumarium TaxID=1170767 RepID=A0AAJ0GY75_9PEZI|nr:mitochondrial carrier domain-containing protein [Chaetomium strumarium]
MTETKDAGLSPAFVETVAGLSAGTMATLIVHPLDIVKTRMQVHRSTLVSSGSSTSRTLTTVSVIRSLTRTDRPLAALYRGLTPNLLGNATSWASFFFFKSRLERGLAHLRGPQHHDHDHDRVEETQAQVKQRLTPADFFAASLAAGALTQVITNPIWVLKTRMLASDRSAAGAYPSMWAGAVRLLREEGVRGFYRGMGVGMLAVSHGAVQFAVYDPARKVYLARKQKGRARLGGCGDEGQGQGQGQVSVSNEATVVLSTVSKLVAGAATYPLQVLRSRLQHHDAEEQFGKGIRGVVRKLWQEEGVRGFYKGVMPGVVRVLPATWVTFLVYENVKYYLPRWAQGGKEHVVA